MKLLVTVRKVSAELFKSYLYVCVCLLVRRQSRTCALAWVAELVNLRLRLCYVKLR